MQNYIMFYIYSVNMNEKLVPKSEVLLLKIAQKIVKKHF